MNPNNDICQFYLRKKCRYGDECFKKHERQSYSKRDDDIPILTFKVAAKSDEKNVQQILTDKPTTHDAASGNHKDHKNVQQTLTDGPTAHDAAFDSTKNVNEIHPEKSTNAPTNQDFNDLKRENKMLLRKYYTLETTVNTLRKQIRKKKQENAELIGELNYMQLEDEDFKCPVCFEVFIMPSLVDCSHMFCEWCIDKMLEKSAQCPICRKNIYEYIYCSNTANIIKKMIEQMPETFQIKFKKIEVSRAKDKPKSLQLRAEREKLESIRNALNGHIFSN